MKFFFKNYVRYKSVILKNDYVIKTLSKSNHSMVFDSLNYLHLKKPKVYLFENSKIKNGFFNLYKLSSAKDFELMSKKTINETDLILKEALDENRNRKMVEVFDDLSNTLCKTADLCEFIKNTHPSLRFIVPAEEVSFKISELVEKLNTNKDLYLALKNVVDKGDHIKTDEIDNYVCKLFLIDMEQSGINLDEEKRNAIVNLNNQIFELSRNFIKKSYLPVLIEKKFISQEIPAKFKKLKKSKSNKIEINSTDLDNSDRFSRELSYKAYYSYNEELDKILTKLIETRKKLANLCGFKSYSHRVLKGSIADDPKFVNQFLLNISEKIKVYSQQDYDFLLDFNKEIFNCNDTNLKAWDLNFLINQFKDMKTSSNLSSSIEYFTLGNCLNGLNLLFNKIYNIELKIEDTSQEYCWVDDLIKLSVIDKQNNKLLGNIYCDIFERENKLKQDCHFTIRGSCLTKNNDYQTPIVVISLNFPSYPFKQPYFLNPFQVDNLFHEMGHAMHSMIAQTKYQHVSGTRTSTDLAEIPSILMENFSSDKRILSLFAKHYLTNEPLPENKMNEWILFKKIFIASETQLQVFYSLLDQSFHSENPLAETTTKTLEKFQNNYFGLKYVEETACQLKFTHLINYGGRYYSYLLSRSISNLIWDKFFNEDPLNLESGLKFKNEFLKYGASIPPKKLIEEFLNEKIEPNILAQSIIKEVSFYSSFKKGS